MNPKKIAVVQLYFYPDISAVSQLLGDLLKEIADDAKYEISVFCSRSYHGERKKEDLRLLESFNIEIRYIATFNFGKKNFVTRLLDYFLYYISIFIYFLFSFKWDLIIAMTSPPLIGCVISAATLFTGVPFIYYVQDLYPELLYDMGYIKSPQFVRKMRALNSYAMRSANRVITIGEYMTKKVLDNYQTSGRRISEINNWTVGIEYSERKKMNEFTLLYSGNMGLAHDFSNLAALIRKLAMASGIRYRFIGGGQARADIENIFDSEKESRVAFQDYTDRSVHSSLIAEADLFIIAQKQETVGDILPSKLYSYLAAGRPILFLGPLNSEIGKLIINNDIGVVLETQDDAFKVAELIKSLICNRSLAVDMGRRARTLFENKYRLTQSAEKFTRVIDYVLGLG